ncbi:hypothetical protein C1J03_14735 [Sulfitobacter sp. SK012]|nr:hypothetical protein C1J03_14735 [Sulfitobacter sp. SK012]
MATGIPIKGCLKTHETSAIQGRARYKIEAELLEMSAMGVDPPDPSKVKQLSKGCAAFLDTV